MLFVSKKEIRDGREGTKVCKRQSNDTEKIFAEPHLMLLWWWWLMPGRVVWRNLVEEMRSGWRGSLS